MLQMKLCGDLILRERCADVSEITPEILSMLEEMEKLMTKQKGVGLAAPQIGIAKRFLIMMDLKAKKPIKMINPKIVSKSENVIIKEEGCLSIIGPDDLPVFTDVARSDSVTVEWTDEKGNKQRVEMKNFMARIVQHEIDHLDGILFIDHLSPVKREMVMNKVRKRK